jgi:hypothetical protein
MMHVIFGTNGVVVLKKTVNLIAQLVLADFLQLTRDLIKEETWKHNKHTMCPKHY